jgi:hypothetical protein
MDSNTGFGLLLRFDYSNLRCYSLWACFFFFNSFKFQHVFRLALHELILSPRYYESRIVSSDFNCHVLLLIKFCQNNSKVYSKTNGQPDITFL